MTPISENNIFGIYANLNVPIEEQEQLKKYLWGDDGLQNKLKALKWQVYGEDFQLILFQFYAKPIPAQREILVEIEKYRRKEKSIGLPVIIDDANFFGLNEKNRQNFLSSTILKKLDLLKERIRMNKLDLNIDKLINDTTALLCIQ